MAKLSFQTALVTGASRGIGRAIAVALAHAGIKRLLLVARSPERLKSVARELEKLPVEVIGLPLDLTQTVAVDRAMTDAWANHGPIDLLVNCAGVAHQSLFLEANLAQIREEISLNLLGTYTVTRAIARCMAQRGEGTIVNVSSLMGKVAAPTLSTYSATKFALIGFTKALRSELAPANVRVVALLPSLTDTDMSKQIQLFKGVLPMTSEQVARALLTGLARGTQEIVVGWQSHLALWCQRLAPGLLDKIVNWAAPHRQKPRESISLWKRRRKLLFG